MAKERIMQGVQLKDKYFIPYISEQEIQQACSRLAEKINTAYDGKRPLFLAVLNGSFIFAADLYRNITIPSDISFIKMASYEGTSSSGNINQLIGLNEDLSGRHVIIVEDIVDTGKTLQAIMLLMEKHRVASVATATLLFKPEAYKLAYEITYAGIRIPHKFVVGYGLDYDGHGRNLRSIYILEEN